MTRDNTSFKLTFLLPTCEPDEMFRWLQPSIKRLAAINEFISFAIIFQPPYTESEIKLVTDEFEKYGIDYKYIYKDFKVVKPYTPLVTMRHECSLMYPDSNAYALLDDDMSFTDDSICAYYIKAIECLIDNPDIAVIGFNDYERRYENIFATNNGIVYRGGIYYGFKGFIPEHLSDIKGYQTLVPYENEKLINLFGGFQDKFCAMIRLCNGSKAAQLINTPTKHVENRKIRGAQDHGWEEAKYSEGSVAQFITKYFNPWFLKSCSMTLFAPDLMEKIYPGYYDDSDKTNNIELLVI